MYATSGLEKASMSGHQNRLVKAWKCTITGPKFGRENPVFGHDSGHRFLKICKFV